MRQVSDHPVWNQVLSMLYDDAVSELNINGPNSFYCMKRGVREKIEVPSLSGRRYLESIVKGLVPLMDSPTEYSEDDVLHEGPLRIGDFDTEGFIARCTVVFPPLAESPTVVIAKKSRELATLERIASEGSMSASMLDFIHRAVDARLTCVISGSSGAGKTTMLEALTKYIPRNIRFGVAEDTPELILTQPNTTYLRSIPWRPNMDANRTADLSWVVKQFNRLRLDRLIIGETRGKEFADFLVAANSGMDGSLTTIHANSPTLAVDKMTRFALAGTPGQPIRSASEDIGQTIDLVIQLDRVLVNGSFRYRTTQIAEVSGTVADTADAKLSLNTLFEYEVANDCFVKRNNPSDKLMKTIEQRGVDTQPIREMRPGTSEKAFKPLFVREAPRTVEGAPAEPAAASERAVSPLKRNVGRQL